MSQVDVICDFDCRLKVRHCALEGPCVVCLHKNGIQQGELQTAGGPAKRVSRADVLFHLL